MLEEGSLDSLTWGIIRSFYIQPINIPNGELGILIELFPEVSRNLPVSPKELEKFKPWDDKQIHGFFQKYPELIKFRPILKFDMPYKSRIGRVGFFYHDPPASPASHYGQINLNAVKWIKFQGRVDFTDAFARWQRRTLKISPAPWCELQAGNIDAFSDRGLLYGYFPPCSSVDSLAGENWLYGNGNTWNGLLVKLSGVRNRAIMPCIKVFSHSRPSEKISGFDVEFKAYGKLTFHMGMSSLKIPIQEFSVTYLHSGLKMKFGRWEGELENGFDPLEPQKIPLYLSNIFSNKESRLELAGTFLPAGLYAPESRVVRLLTAFPERPLTENVTLVNLKAQHTITENMWVLPAMEFRLSDKTIEHCRSSLGANWKLGPVESQLVYTREMSGSGLESTGNFVDGNCTADLNRFLLLEVSNRIFWRGQKIKLRYSIVPRIQFSARLSLEPCLYLTKSEKGYLIQVGIKQTFRLFESTYTEFVVEKPSGNGLSKEPIRIDAKAWFLF